MQAEAILNMRLRSLRRLEELELLAERDALMAERAALADHLAERRCNGCASAKSWRGAKAVRKGHPAG